MSPIIDMPGNDMLWRRRDTSLVEHTARERDVLSKVAQGEPLSSVLDALLIDIEEFSDFTIITSILKLSDDGQRLTHLAGPNLPVEFREFIDGTQIGEGVGSCGTVVYRRAPVYVTDIANDPLWVDYRDAALSHDLRACWSTPIIGTDGYILGTFAVYYETTRSPEPRDMEAIASIALTVALAMERHRSDARIRHLSGTLDRVADGKASDRKSEPALNRSAEAPLHRMQRVLRDPLINIAKGHRTLTEAGRLVLHRARMMLEDNRRAIEMASAQDAVRVGIGNVFFDRFAHLFAEINLRKVRLSTGICFEVADAFARHELDVAYVLDVRDNRQKLDGHVVAEHRIEVAWAKAENATFAKDEPIPLALYPGDNPVLEALRDAGQDFEIVVFSSEYSAKLLAVRSGKCVTPMPRPFIEAPFTEFDDIDLPSIPAATILVAVRGESRSPRFREILSALSGLHLQK